MAHVSEYPGKLILPNGDEIASGAEVTLTKEQAENPSVKDWIEAGWLVEEKAKGPAKKAE